MQAEESPQARARRNRIRANERAVLNNQKQLTEAAIARSI